MNTSVHKKHFFSLGWKVKDKKCKLALTKQLKSQSVKNYLSVHSPIDDLEAS